MSFMLEQVAIPVAYFADQPDLASYGDYITYFVTQIGAMRANGSPCQNRVRLSADLAEKMWGIGNVPPTDESETLALLTTLGNDQYGIRIYLDRELAENRARLE